MSRCQQCGGDGHRPQPPAPRKAPPPVVSTRTLKCAKCGTPLADHEMFGACFPAGFLGECPPLVMRNGRLVAV